MMIRDTTAGYGVVTRVLHWTMAIALVGLFALGYWMVGLDYYSAYYNSAPNLHRGAGMLLLAALVFRTTWRLSSPKPSNDDLSALERRAATVAHWSFYPLMLALCISGYFISTLDGRAIDVFGLFSIPSVVEAKGYEDVAGLTHEYLAYATMALAIAHTLAALKHHVVDRKSTLVRMWSGAPDSVSQARKDSQQ